MKRFLMGLKPQGKQPPILARGSGFFILPRLALILKQGQVYWELSGSRTVRVVHPEDVHELALQALRCLEGRTAWLRKWLELSGRRMRATTLWSDRFLENIPKVERIACMSLGKPR
jgi:hypothetical protein